MTNNHYNHKGRISGSQTILLTFIALAGIFIGSFFIFDFQDGAKLLFEKVTAKTNHKAPVATDTTDSAAPVVYRDTLTIETHLDTVAEDRKLFYEIEFEPAAIIDSIISEYLTGNSRLVYSFEQNSKISDTLREELRYRKWLAANLPDSELNQMLVSKQLFINRDSFDESCLMVTDTGKKTRKTSSPILWDYYINYSLKYHKPIIPFHLQSEVRQRVCYFNSNNDFFTANPPFLLWALLLIIQYGLFPALTLSGIIVVRNFKMRYPDVYKRKKNKWLIYFYPLLSAFTILVLVYSAFFTFFNPNYLRTGLFYVHLSGALVAGSFFSGLTGTICFTGFLLISGTRNHAETDNEITEREIDLLNDMNVLFNNLLIIASLVLCMIVLTTGSLYSSIGELEFIKKVHDDIGYTPFGYSNVMLVASLCSLLLLFFFVPAKLRLMAMETRIKKIDPDDKRIGKPADILGIAKSIFIVGLPVITSIVHFVISSFANK